MEGTIKDVTKATAKVAPRKRPRFLFLPYITHTLNIRTTENVRSGAYARIIWSDILSTQAKLA